MLLQQKSRNSVLLDKTFGARHIGLPKDPPKRLRKNTLPTGRGAPEFEYHAPDFEYEYHDTGFAYRDPEFEYRDPEFEYHAPEFEQYGDAYT